MHTQKFTLPDDRVVDTFYVGLSPENNQPMWVTQQPNTFYLSDLHNTDQDPLWDAPTLKEMTKIMQNDELKKHFNTVVGKNPDVCAPLIELRREDSLDGIRLFDVATEGVGRSHSMRLVSRSANIYVRYRDKNPI